MPFHFLEFVQVDDTGKPQQLTLPHRKISRPSGSIRKKPIVALVTPPKPPSYPPVSVKSRFLCGRQGDFLIFLNFPLFIIHFYNVRFDHDFSFIFPLVDIKLYDTFPGIDLNVVFNGISPLQSELKPRCKVDKAQGEQGFARDWLDEDEPEEVECWLFDEELSLE